MSIQTLLDSGVEVPEYCSSNASNQNGKVVAGLFMGTLSVGSLSCSRMEKQDSGTSPAYQLSTEEVRLFMYNPPILSESTAHAEPAPAFSIAGISCGGLHSAATPALVLKLEQPTSPDVVLALKYMVPQTAFCGPRHMLFATMTWASSNYDLSHITAYAKALGVEHFDILLLCPDKQAWLAEVNSNSGDETAPVAAYARHVRYLADILDLRAALAEYRKHRNSLLEAANRQPSMLLRLHQHLIVMKGMDKIKTFKEQNPNPSKDSPCTLAVGALPRSGKSYMGAGLAHLYNLHLQQQGAVPPTRGARVLVLTTQPTETSSTWSDVFSSHPEFNTLPKHGGTAEYSGAACGMQVSDEDGNNVFNGLGFLPAGWVVMSKQSFDNCKKRCNKAATAARAGQSGNASTDLSTRDDSPASSAQQPEQFGVSDADAQPADDELHAGSAESSSDSMVGLEDIRTARAEKVNIIACDKETARELGPGDGPTLQQVIGEGFDVVLFDEAHLGSTTELSKEAVQLLMAGSHTLLVLITATYMRPVGGYDVPSDRLLSWSLLDVGYARSGSMQALAERHGEKYLLGALKYCGITTAQQSGVETVAELHLSAEQLEAFKSLYSNVPKLMLKRLLMGWPDVQSYMPHISKANGLSFKALFEMIMSGQKRGDRKLLHPEAVAVLVSKLFGGIGGSIQHPAAEGTLPTAMQIDEDTKPVRESPCSKSASAVAISTGSADASQTATPFRTIIVFLHYCPGCAIQPLCKRFQEVCERDSIGKDYAYFILSGYNVPSRAGGGLAAVINEKAEEAWAAGKKGLVMLTGNRGGVGLDVKAIDETWMLTDAEALDSWMQRAFRCLTERRANDTDVQGPHGATLPAKTHGVVVDAYPHRVLQTLLQYCSIGGDCICAHEMLQVLSRSGVVDFSQDFLASYTSEELDDSSSSHVKYMPQWQDRVLYSAAKLLNEASLSRTVSRLQSHSLCLAPEQLSLLTLKTGGSSKKGQALQNAAGGGKAAAPQGGSGAAEPEPDQQGNQQQTQEETDQKGNTLVPQLLTRLATLLTFMSHRNLAAAKPMRQKVKPDLATLLSWLKQQEHCTELQHSIAYWIEWQAGYAADYSEAAAAWQQLYAVGQNLKSMNAELHADLLQLAVHYRLQLTQAIDDMSSSRSTSGSSGSSGSSSVNAGSTSVAGSKTAVVKVINDALEMCGGTLAYSITPKPLVHQILNKLVAADKVCGNGLFAPPIQQQQRQHSAGSGAAPEDCAGTSAAAALPAATITAVLPALVVANDAGLPRILDLGAGTGGIAAALYDKLVQAGWPADVVERRLLVVAEPDLTMQYLLSVIFPKLQPQSFKPALGGTSSADIGSTGDSSREANGAGSHDSGASSSSSSRRSTGSTTASFPANIGEIPMPAFSNPRSSKSAGSPAATCASCDFTEQRAESFNAIIGFLPQNRLYTTSKRIISHLLASTACTMLKPGGHAMLLLNNRWRCSKGTREHYQEVRAQLVPHLGDVWDVLTSKNSRSLLRGGVVSNGGQHLLHLIKAGHSEEASSCRQKHLLELQYKHVHSSLALHLLTAASEQLAGNNLGRPPADDTMQKMASAAGEGAGAAETSTIAAATQTSTPTTGNITPDGQIVEAEAAIAAEMITKFDAIVRVEDLPILAKVAQFFAKQAVAAGLTSEAALSHLTLTSALKGLAVSSYSQSRTELYSVRCYRTKIQNKNQLEEGDSSEEEDIEQGGTEACEDAASPSSSGGDAAGEPVYYVTAATAVPNPKAGKQRGPAPSLQKWKVITTVQAKRAPEKGSAAGFNRNYIKVLEPGDTFAGEIRGWEFNSKAEATNFAAYLQSLLPNFIASLLKEDNKIHGSLMFIPMPDISQPWDQDHEQQQLQRQFNLTAAEVKHLEYRVYGVQQHCTVCDARTGTDILKAFTAQEGSAFMVKDWMSPPSSSKPWQPRKQQQKRQPTNPKAAGRRKSAQQQQPPGKRQRLGSGAASTSSAPLQREHGAPTNDLEASEDTEDRGAAAMFVDYMAQEA